MGQYRGSGAVAAGSLDTASVAADVLRAGGNAFDAVVAAGFAACAAEPILVSLGGGGFVLVRTALGEEVLVDAFVAAPDLGPTPDGARPSMDAVEIQFGAASQTFHVGGGSVAVPGLLPGLRHVWERWGRLDWAQVLSPAVVVARQGVAVDAVLERVVGLVWPILSRTETGHRLFGVGGRPVSVGDWCVSEELPATLEEVASERRLGWTAAELGGSITPDDLAAYQVVERVPLRVEFCGASVVSNPAPSFGATLVVHGLEVIEAGREGPIGGSLVASGLRAMTDRRSQLGPGASRGTTQVSVVDGEGNAASMTVSNGSGSGVFVEGSGVQLNNMLGEEDLHPGALGDWVAGERVGSMMAPILLELADGTVVAAGSGGSERIRSALLQFVVEVAGRGRSVVEAVAAPRLHWDGEAFQAEAGCDPQVLERLEADGFAINRWSGRDFYFGGVHAAVLGPGGFAAVGDERRGGVGFVVEG